MKKAIGIIVAVLLIGGMVFLLAGNKKKMEQQAASTIEADRAESVTTCTANLETYNLDFTANGATQAVSELNFVSDVSGRVVSIYVDKGSRVAKGTPLLKIDTELYEADYKAAQTAYDALKKDEQRFARSNEAGGVTDQQLDNIRTQLTAAESRLAASRWKYENSVVKSPMAGTVNTRFVEVGALIAPNAPLFEIVNDNSLKVICNVPETRVKMLAKGQTVTATDASLPGKVFTGKINHIGIKTDRGLNYPVEIVLDKDSQLRIGMYLKVQFSDSEGRTGILVPRKAIVGSTKAANVYVVENGKASRREVTIGEMVGDRVEIVEGLQDGDKVILSGLMNIGEGSAVNVISEQ